jgi:DNA gyrase subunit B
MVRSITWSSLVGSPRANSRSSASRSHTGTLITFKPDAEIFTITTEFKFDVLANRLRELAFLNPGVEIVLLDEREEDKQEVFSTGTASSSSSGSWAATNRPPPQTDRALAHKDEVFVDCVLQYNDSYNDQILCFANSIANPDGGTHLTGFRTALTRAINQYTPATT